MEYASKTMICITPITIKRDYRTINGDFTDIVPCGKCPPCKKKRRNNWSLRLEKEIGQSKSACFMTLTYAEAPISFNGHPTLQRDDFTLFIKRLRKCAPKTPYIKKNGSTGYTSSLKYYAVGEYGTKYLRPHYHIILFGLHPHFLKRPNKVANIWGHGSIDIAECNIRTINYVTSYVMQGSWVPTQDDDDRVAHFATMSKNLGISYLTPQTVKFHISHMLNAVIGQGGQYQQLPRYYKDKIFSREEKKQLAIEAKNSMKWI